ncbi:ABC transporter ATP-binding protein [Lachnoanaerobaculum gingivalis]|uniref:ABC transporter ATP-binding protein n=1 Tax=Lachnoanaerobaculum gingivalis TaxID=2490855 RepID=A0A3P3QVC2_9FIRM|nr:ABC transporter ATP-binding protein [Lachnoanaerobaculum gingivalis]RRJ24499.1 ABC transporter ATP-binding protein [Lachnoanaerobaculum gingivalis]
MRELLKFENINISYEKRQVLYDLSFSLNSGEILGVVGNSGCGKSTLLKSIMGLSGPKVLTGNIFFENIDLLSLNASEMRRIRGNRISMVFQESGIHTNPLKTIGDTVFESMKAHKQISKEEALDTATVIFENLSLPDPKRILNAYPFELSGGMNQRVGIALAMLNRPSLILADEPTSALDPIVAVQIENELKSLREKYNTAIILVTHNIKIARNITDRILVLNNGKTVDYGKTCDVLSSPKSDFTKELILSASG